VPVACRRRDDHALRPDVTGALRQLLRGPPFAAHEIVDIHAELADGGWVPQVEHRKVGRLDLPQLSPLRAGINRATRGRPPLRPDRRGLQRGIERPRLGTAVVAPIDRGGAIGREGRRIDAGLAMDTPAEPAQGAQT